MRSRVIYDFQSIQNINLNKINSDNVYIYEKLLQLNGMFVTEDSTEYVDFMMEFNINFKVNILV